MEELVNIIKNCSNTGFSILVKALLCNIGCLEDFEYSINKDILKGVVSFEFSGIKSKCLVFANQQIDRIVSEEDVNNLIAERERKEMKKAIFITLSSFSQDVRKYIDDINLVLIDRQYLQDNWLDILMYISDSDYVLLEKQSKSTSNRKKLKVTFPDGTVFCDEDSSETLKQAIRYIGIEKVASAGLMISREPLLTKTVNPKYAKYYKPIEGDWFITLQSDTGIRMRQLLALNIRLGINMKVEEGTELVVKTKTNKKKKSRQFLLVDFEDGTSLGGFNQTDSFIEAIMHIGTEKVKNLTWRDEPLVTKYKKNNNQVQLENGEWLTIPNSTKDKFKMLSLVSSYTRIKMKLSIIT